MQTPETVEYPSVLIATLGSEPQVVTSALALLTRQDLPVQSLQVVHSTQQHGPIGAAVEALRGATQAIEFPEGVDMQFFPIRTADGESFEDVETPEAGEAVFRLLYALLRSAKQEGRRVHLLIAGGRKTMSIYGMVAAQLLFDDEDNLWHLHSSGEFLASRRLFPQEGDDVRLVSIPVFPWRQVSPALSDLREVDDPLAAIERYRRQRLDERYEQARLFVVGQLTPAERRAVTLLVTEGLPDQEIAERLSLSARTVEHQLRAAFRKAAEWWGLAEVNRTMLITLLNLYFSLLPGSTGELGENPDDGINVAR